MVPLESLQTLRFLVICFKNADLADSMEPGVHWQPSLVLKFHPHPPSLYTLSLFHWPFSTPCCLLLAFPSVCFPLLISLFLFSRFHLAATRGHLDCLNLILGHSVDVTASDATGEYRLDESSTLELQLYTFDVFENLVHPHYINEGRLDNTLQYNTIQLKNAKNIWYTW